MFRLSRHFQILSHGSHRVRRHSATEYSHSRAFGKLSVFYGIQMNANICIPINESSERTSELPFTKQMHDQQ
ncbi:hypothetical protein FGIG_11099 [Fasciola gigantica]|uniref:Uncharacterized protein n=1 Tax=Fasciola gigantica TaxID=46835 RepID=A0A504Z0Z9_FASGI|nr:hypothetical protein FGIG_11099 [Fasciola gigantica]